MVTRIRELLDNKELSPTQFADLIGVGRPVVSHILSERNKPSLEVVQRIIGAFPEISLPWLLSGVGNMLDEAAPAVPAPLPAREEELAATPASVTVEAALSTPLPVAATATPAAAASTLPPPVGQPEVPPAAPRPVAAPYRVAVEPKNVLPPVGLSPAASPVAEPAAAPALSPSVPAAKPSRAPRFVPPAPASTIPAVQAARTPTPPPQPEPQAAPGALPAAASPLAPALPPTQPAASAAMLPFLAEPGKAIRRIVIFYRDGSFADYQPEA